MMIALALVASSLGCIKADANVAKLAELSEELRPRIPKGCQLTLQLIIPKGNVTNAVASKTYAVASEEVCIRDSPTSALSLPRNLRLFFQPLPHTVGPHSRYILCEDSVPASDYLTPTSAEGARTDTTTSEETPPQPAPPHPDTIGGKEVETCIWNGDFRDRYPMSFIFRDKTETGKVRDQIQLIHVFRNGALAYAWKPGQTGAEPLNQRDKMLVIPGDALETNRVPHLADFDMRVYSSTVAIDERVLTLEVEKTHNALVERLKVAGTAVLESEEIAGGELEKVVACFKSRLERIRHYAEAVAGTAQGDPPALDGGCAIAALALPEGYVSFKEQLEKLDGRYATSMEDALAALQAAFEADIAKAPKEVQKALEAFETIARGYLDGNDFRQELLARAKASPTAAQAVIADRDDTSARRKLFETDDTSEPPTVTKEDIDWLKLRLAGFTTTRVLEAAQEMASETAEGIDDVRSLVVRLRADAISIVNDSDKQLRLYDNVARSLVEEGDFFEAYADNPAVPEGAAVLPMAYSDSTQFYFLSAWLGVPLRLEEPKVEFNETAAIPIIDLVGLRNQIGRTRFGDIRLGAGIVLFEADFLVDPITKQPVKEKEGAETREVVVFGPQVNLGIANFKVGYNYILTCDSCAHMGVARMRVLLGVDVIKLISGEDSAAL